MSASSRLYCVVLLTLLSCLLTAPLFATPTESETRPNVIFILGDDMSYDSVAAFNEKCLIPTPCLDHLTSEGMSFTDAHSGSAVCSPTRYGVLTGRYSWRTSLKRGIVGLWQPPLINLDRMTVGDMFLENGYDTACIGKWHLGWTWHDADGNPTTKAAQVDFTQPVTGGPIEQGFNYYYGDDVPNWPPYVWIENDRTLGIPSVPKPASMFGTAGPMLPGWSLEAVLPAIMERSVEYIHAQAETEEPFFLYFPLTSPHSPIAPSEEFKGKSGISDYADFVMETDWVVGNILDALEDTDQADDTVVIFTCDNGTSRICDFAELESHGVDLRNHYRGSKADAWDGGHRVPFIVRYPGIVEPSSTCDETICLIDFMATAAEILDFELPADSAEDSMSLMPLLRGETLDDPLHGIVVHHSISGYFAVRKGDWKLLYCRGSGGWTSPTEAQAAQANLPSIQLYNMRTDPKESNNLYEEHPEIVAELTADLQELVNANASRPDAERSVPEPAHWGQLPWDEAGKVLFE
jgi:arylsulfatase A